MAKKVTRSNTIDQENGTNAEKDKTESATVLGRRTKEDIYIEKWDQTGSPEIPHRGDIRNLRPPFGGLKHQTSSKSFLFHTQGKCESFCSSQWFVQWVGADLFSQSELLSPMSVGGGSLRRWIFTSNV